MKAIVLGSNGMLGHIVTMYLKEQGHEIIETVREEGSKYYFDAFKNVYAIEKIIDSVSPDAVINCIGILNQAAEDNHALASMVNGFLPNYLDLLSEKYNFKFVHITTDCVFDGSAGNYDEKAIPNATSFYGRSKALGEVNNSRTLTLRTSIVGPDINPQGIGLFQWFSKQTGTVTGYSEIYWTGVTTVELARVIEEGIANDISGLNHVVNNEKIKKSDLLRLFNQHFNFNLKIFDNDSKKSDKSLIRTKLSYDFNVPSYDEMIKNMREWVDAHPNIYKSLIERMR